MKYVAETRNVSKKYGQQTVLDNVSLSCESGRIYGLVGRNGSGKTVLLKCLCGILQPTSGDVVVWGQQLNLSTDYPDNIGFIIESPGFLPHESGLSNLIHLASIRKKVGIDDIRQSMIMVGLDPNLKKHVGKYSMGMRQRLGIAQAIMEKPGLLILDEPMNGLDNQGVDRIRKLLLSLKEQGTCIILASHYKEDIDYLCDKVYRMDAGTITHME